MGDDAYLSAIGSNIVLNQFPLKFSYKGDYTSGTNTSFNQNDVVYQGSPSNLYYANKNINPKPGTFNSNDWTQINVDFKDEYDSTDPAVAYNQYDVVRYTPSPPGVENLYYANKAIAGVTGGPRSFVSADWNQIQQLSGMNLDNAERIKIAIEYQAAILLILSLPQLIEEQILRERVRFQEIDWEKRSLLYESLISDILDKVSPDPIFTTSSATFGCVNQRLAF